MGQTENRKDLQLGLGPFNSKIYTLQYINLDYKPVQYTIVGSLGMNLYRIWNLLELQQWRVVLKLLCRSCYHQDHQDIRTFRSQKTRTWQPLCNVLQQKLERKSRLHFVLIPWPRLTKKELPQPENLSPSIGIRDTLQACAQPKPRYRPSLCGHGCYGRESWRCWEHQIGASVDVAWCSMV